MQKVLTPYELLVRWSDDGMFQGAHFRRLERVLDDDGSLYAARELDPEPLSPNAGVLAPIVGQALLDAADALAIVTAERAALVSERDALAAERDALAALVAELTEEVPAP